MLMIIKIEGKLSSAEPVPKDTQLLSKEGDCEHWKYFRKVYCFVSSYNRDQDTQIIVNTFHT